MFFMKNEWFQELGWIYTPISWQGLLLTLAAFLFSVHVFYIVDMESETFFEMIYGVFPYWVSALGILFWIASKTVKK